MKHKCKLIDIASSRINIFEEDSAPLVLKFQELPSPALTGWASENTPLALETKADNCTGMLKSLGKFVFYFSHEITL